MSDLPKDSRTIFKKSEKIVIRSESGQQYFFFEPLNQLKILFQEYRSKIGQIEILSISLNIDGVSTFKNAKKNEGFWSILGKLHGLKKDIVFPLAMCYGKGKPVSLDFMKVTMTSLHSLFDNGFQNVRFVPKLICCDLPAKSLVKAIFPLTQKKVLVTVAK